MLDICPAPANPADLERDLIDLGPESVGLYVVNLSVPSCVVSPQYVRALVADGVGVLPIIVPGNSPPADLDLVGALKGWGVPPAPVAIDLEDGSTPPLAWVQRKVQELTGAGYQSALYGTAFYQGMYNDAAWWWRWLADWTFREGITPGYQAQQWSNDATAPSGRRYDISDVEDQIVLWGHQAFEPPLETVDPMPDEVSFPAVRVEPAPCKS